MKTSLFFCVIFFLLHISSLSAQRIASIIPSSMAPAGTSATYAKRWCAFHNPAAISTQRSDFKVSASVTYDNRFALKELSTISAAVSVNTKYTDIGLALSRFGYSVYNESAYGIAFSKTFTNRFSAAVQFNYYCIGLPNSEGTHGNIIAQIGLMSEVLPHFIVGFHAFNPTQTNIELKYFDKQIPSVMSLGGAYIVQQELLFAIQLDKESDSDLQWRVGAEWELIQHFCLRIGGSGSPFVPIVGAGFSLKRMFLDVAFEKHPTLGVNSNCGLSYHF